MSGLEVEVLPIFFAAREAGFGPQENLPIPWHACRLSGGHRTRFFGSTGLLETSKMTHKTRDQKRWCNAQGVVDSTRNERSGTSPSSGLTSLRLDVGRPYHLGPLLGLVEDEPSEADW
jgi:hypothetical protein